MSCIQGWIRRKSAPGNRQNSPTSSPHPSYNIITIHILCNFLTNSFFAVILSLFAVILHLFSVVLCLFVVVLSLFRVILCILHMNFGVFKLTTEAFKQELLSLIQRFWSRSPPDPFAPWAYFSVCPCMFALTTKYNTQRTLLM